jgi:hypothetical protein
MRGTIQKLSPTRPPSPILPFSERFGALDAGQRAVYLGCLIVTTASSALLIAPTAQHRLGFPSRSRWPCI